MTDASIARAAAQILSAAQLACQRIDHLPAHLAPHNLEEAFAIQDAFVEIGGGKAGYKVAQSKDVLSPVEEMVYAPLLKRDVPQSPAVIFLPPSGLIVVEGEIGYRLIRDLPSRNAPYSEDEILDAVEALPAIEILWSRFADVAKVDGYSKIADLIFSGAYVTGTPIKNWRKNLPDILPARVTINGKEVFKSDAVAHPNGRPYSSLLWFANEGARRLGGLKKGEVVATGSYTGAPLIAPPANIELEFKGFGGVSVEIRNGQANAS